MIARLRPRSHAAYAEPAQGVHSSMYVGFGGQGLTAGVGGGRLHVDTALTSITICMPRLALADHTLVYGRLLKAMPEMPQHHDCNCFYF